MGLYLVSAQGRIKTFNSYNASVSNINLGICYGNTYNFTSANTTRIAFVSTGALNTSGTNNFMEVLTVVGVLNMSATGNYIGAFINVSAAQAATTGSVDCIVDYCMVTKIA